MPEAERKFTGRVLYSVVAVLTIVQSGCLLAIAGATAGAAATGYLYYKGRIYRDYPAALPLVRNAVHDALLDLKFPILTEEFKDGKALLVTKTTAGKKIRLHLDCLNSPIPAESLLTRVSVRVDFFGDEGVSARILDQVTWRLTQAPPIVPAPPAGPAPIQQTSSVRPFETLQPPLAAPEPVKQK
jgi:Protein of unknown function (DUF3568)